MDLLVLESIISISMTIDGEGEGESKVDLFEGGLLPRGHPWLLKLSEWVNNVLWCYDDIQTIIVAWASICFKQANTPSRCKLAMSLCDLLLVLVFNSLRSPSIYHLNISSCKVMLGFVHLEINIHKLQHHVWNKFSNFVPPPPCYRWQSGCSSLLPCCSTFSSLQLA